MKVDQDNLTIIEISLQDKGIFIYQIKYIKEMPKKFKVEDCKPILTAMVTVYKNIHQRMSTKGYIDP